jgi:PIN domain nuclease of toxin-antitoxin system
MKCCSVLHRFGKLPLPHPPAEYLPRHRSAHGILSLSIDEGSMPHLAMLPLLHRDPFDRMLVAQALQHGLTIVTLDPLILADPVPCLPQI